MGFPPHHFHLGKRMLDQALWPSGERDQPHQGHRAEASSVWPEVPSQCLFLDSSAHRSILWASGPPVSTCLLLSSPLHPLTHSFICLFILTGLHLSYIYYVIHSDSIYLFSTPELIKPFIYFTHLNLSSLAKLYYPSFKNKDLESQGSEMALSEAKKSCTWPLRHHR